MRSAIMMLSESVSNTTASATSEDSVSLLEVLVPICGWVVLTVGFCLRFRRQPRSISA
ncbi:MAG: hypothetical protein ABL953_06095 [Ilumatobacteraceae bacterium]